jgi:hypothetical protein
MGCSVIGPTPLGMDNQSAIKFAQNHVFHDKTKHLKLIGMLQDKRLKVEKSRLNNM